MSLPLRITVDNKDYTYTILTKGIGKDTSEIKIEIEGEELTIARSVTGEWDVMERAINDDQQLLTAITRNIVLRYRLK